MIFVNNIKQHFAVDGQWSAWQEWQICNTTCGNGSKHRIRECDSPSPYFGALNVWDLILTFNHAIKKYVQVSNTESLAELRVTSQQNDYDCIGRGSGIQSGVYDTCRNTNSNVYANTQFTADNIETGARANASCNADNVKTRVNPNIPCNADNVESHAHAKIRSNADKVESCAHANIPCNADKDEEIYENLKIR
ncbi:unnamed protein product [Mytilus edulis]|uniref:Uncharacterized protein n=1 Tax=Mytilus edulis TaxID=6550 RepID=A0A8S3PZ43_MYTED|nr:unnamed protein product [Mytilus edulis]